MIARSVASSVVGYQYRRSGVSSGHPSVENGHSPDENHVSSTSSSWRKSLPPHLSHAAGRSSATIGSLHRSHQYAGIRWPHQSWREMHQSWRFRIHAKYVFSQNFGWNVVAPFSTASIAAPASDFPFAPGLFTATNH